MLPRCYTTCFWEMRCEIDSPLADECLRGRLWSERGFDSGPETSTATRANAGDAEASGHQR
jgi:hypothetical protein